MAARSLPTQIINGDGVFNVSGLERRVKEEQLKECGVSYTVISIMGPQSSGKSTMLNRLFGTSFQEMDSDEGRYQTTKGIWMARAVGIEPCTLVMDLEGSDGRERGEDDTAFARQSALFALAISDIVLINMWCHDIGREQAANKPLLRTVFQVMARLFTPRKTTLLFVIRDKTRTPFEKLESILRQDIQKIWDSVSKSGAHQGAALSDFFDVQAVALPSFEENRERFDEEMVSLRQRFSHSIVPGGITWDRQGLVDASGFSINAQQIWRLIKENKDLDLPSLTVMVSTIRCEEIAEEKFRCFLQNEDWRRLEEAARSGPEPHFGRQLASILNVCLSGYQKEALPFEERVRISKKEQLEEKLLELAQPVFRSVVDHLRSRALGNFKQAFDKALNQGEGFSSSASCFQKVIARFDEECADATVKQAKWDASKEKGELENDMCAHIVSLQAEKLSERINEYKEKLNDALAGPVEALLGNANDKTWTSIRDLLWRETDIAVSNFTSSIHDFKISEQKKRNILDELEDHATGVVETKAREVVRKVLILMKERFSRLFFPDNDSMRRILTGKENYQTIFLAACSASLKLLAVMAAVRLDYKADNIERTLFVALLDNCSATGAIGCNDSTLDSLVSENWEGVPPSRTLIMPVQCESLWRQFIQENKCVVSQSFSTQVKVDTSLCEEISNKRFLTFSKDEEWLKLKKATRKGPVPDFGIKFSSKDEVEWLKLKKATWKGPVPDFGIKFSSKILSPLSWHEIETKNSDEVARMSNQMQLKGATRKGPVPDFGRKISSMIHACLSGYEIETKNYDEVARMSNQMQLKEKLLHLIRPSYLYILGIMRCDTLYDFQEAFDKALQSGKGFSSAASDCTRHYMALFDEACVGAFIEQTDWDASIVSEDLRRDMDAHVSSVQDRIVNELVKACEGKWNDVLAGSVEALLDGANDKTWSSIRKLLCHETDSAISDFYNALSHFKMDDRTKEKMLDNLRDHAKGVVEEKAREGAKRVSSLMKDRFSRLFFLDNNSMLRVWTKKEDLVAITQAARSSSLKLLSVMAAVRLDDEADNIEGALSAALLYDYCTYRTSDGSESRLSSLVSDTWDKIPPTRTLLTPARCKALWKQFIEETESLVARAIISPS